MSRGLSSAQITVLGKNSIVVESLLEISNAGSTVYLTSAPYNTVATTLTSGGSQTYIKNHTWSGSSQIDDKRFAAQNKIAIFFEGDMSATFGGFSLAPLDFINNTTRFRLYKIFRDSTTNAIESADPILVFDGVLAKKTYIVGATRETLQCDCITTNRPYSFLPIQTVSSIGAN